MQRNVQTHTHAPTQACVYTYTCHEDSSKTCPLVWRFWLYTPLFLNCSLMRWKYISATKFEKDALIEKAINLNIWKGISNGCLPFLFSEKLMQRMLYLLQGRLSFILPELTEIKSDSNLIKNECHCILHGAEKDRKNHIIKHRLSRCICNRENHSSEKCCEWRNEGKRNHKIQTEKKSFTTFISPFNFAAIL